MFSFFCFTLPLISLFLSRDRAVNQQETRQLYVRHWCQNQLDCYRFFPDFFQAHTRLLLFPTTTTDEAWDEKPRGWRYSCTGRVSRVSVYSTINMLKSIIQTSQSYLLTLWRFTGCHHSSVGHLQTLGIAKHRMHRICWQSHQRWRSFAITCSFMVLQSWEWCGAQWRCGQGRKLTMQPSYVFKLS